MRYALFGESHGPGIGIVLQDIPSGLELDMAFIEREMARRAPGGSVLTTARREADAVKLISGVFEGRTTGTPLCAMIENTDVRSADYEKVRRLPRPGHADYTGRIRYGGYNDPRGGGHFSGRLTAPLVFAGAVAKLVLAGRDVRVLARIRETAGIADTPLNMADPDLEALARAADKAFPVLDDERGKIMAEAIVKARGRGDSVGGVIECVVAGLPAGLGGPDFGENVEGVVARHVFAVPAVKGVEFGAGFRLAAIPGSEANDALLPSEDGRIITRTNHNGGVNGGISNGMPLVFAVVIKPTPSIALPQQTVDMQTGKPETLRVEGRHDPCILPRAVPVIEAAAALAVCELLQSRGGL